MVPHEQTEFIALTILEGGYSPEQKRLPIQGAVKKILWVGRIRLEPFCERADDDPFANEASQQVEEKITSDTGASDAVSLGDDSELSDDKRRAITRELFSALALKIPN